MLHSSATSGAWSVLKQSSAKLFPVNTGTLFPADAYLCGVPCVRSIEKFIKLKESLRKKSMIYEKRLLKWDTSFRQKNCLTKTFGALLVQSTLASWPPRLRPPE